MPLTRYPSLAEQVKNVEERCGNGCPGWPEEAPFDSIIVTAAAEGVPPALVAQLKPGGRMVIPVGARYSHQELEVIDKDENGKTSPRHVLGVAFVPLIDDAAVVAR